MVALQEMRRKLAGRKRGSFSSDSLHCQIEDRHCVDETQPFGI